MSAKTYKPKSYTVEAMQYDGFNGREIVEWLADSCWDTSNNTYKQFLAKVKGDVTLSLKVGDWVVKNQFGYVDSINNNAFRRRYEEVK